MTAKEESRKFNNLHEFEISVFAEMAETIVTCYQEDLNDILDLNLYTLRMSTKEDNTNKLFVPTQLGIDIKNKLLSRHPNLKCFDEENKDIFKVIEEYYSSKCINNEIVYNTDEYYFMIGEVIIESKSMQKDVLLEFVKAVRYYII